MSDVTQLLAAAEQGDPSAADQHVVAALQFPFVHAFRVDERTVGAFQVDQRDGIFVDADSNQDDNQAEQN